MQIVMKCFSVFLLAAVEIWAAVPLGFALKLDPEMTCAATVLGAVSGVVAVMALGQKVRDWFLRKRGREGQGRNRLIIRIWDRCGVPGLGLLAPLLTGAPLGAAIGVGLGARAGRLFFWMSLGVVLWSVGLTAAGAAGIQGVHQLWRKFF